MKRPPDNLFVALEIAAKGYVPVAMLPGQKVPAEKWTQWLTRPVTEESIVSRWQNTGNGIAVLCKEMVVFDIDNENELDFVMERTGLRMAPICRTPRGGYHVHARTLIRGEVSRATKVDGREVDLLTGRSLSMIPHSTDARGIPYRWLHGELPPARELPVARVGWIQAAVPQSSVVIPANVASIREGFGGLDYRGMRYVDTFHKRAVAGQNGHTTTFIAAMKIVRFADFDPGLAWRLLQYFNATKCDPPWSEEPELRHKLEDAMRLAHR